MDKKTYIIILIFALLACWQFMQPYLKMQDPALKELKTLELSGLMTGRKANAAFVTGCNFVLMPDGMNSEQFVEWLKEKEVKYVLWSVLEARTRPMLRDLKWGEGYKAVWHKKGWGFIVEVGG